MEAIIIVIFSFILLSCILAGYSILWALLFGYLMFFGYALRQGHTTVQVLTMSGRGIRTIKNILFIFILIGMITAVWRSLRHDTVHYLPYVGPAHTIGIHFDSFSALLFHFTFNRNLFRYCGHDRHHLYVYRQSQWYRSHLYWRRYLIRHLFRRPLFTDVDQRPSDQRTDAD